MFKLLLLTTVFFTHLAMANLSSGYNQKSGKDKQTELWEKVSQSTYADDSLPILSLKSFLQSASSIFGKFLFDPEYLKKTFDPTAQNDELLEERQKLIHGFGSVAKIKFKVHQNSPYSGVFSPNSEVPGLVRLSLAIPGKFIPGMGLKLLIDRAPSVNIVAMNNLDGQDSQNFFENNFSNSIPLPIFQWSLTSFVEDLFRFKLKNAFDETINLIKIEKGITNTQELESIHLPLAHFTKVMGNGSSVAQQDRHTPFVLIFTPSADAVKAGARENRDYRINLKDLNPGQVLYHVLAKETMNSSPLELGELVLESSFTASSYGDRVLFFQHHSEVTDI